MRYTPDELMMMPWYRIRYIEILRGPKSQCCRRYMTLSTTLAPVTFGRRYGTAPWRRPRQNVPASPHILRHHRRELSCGFLSTS